MIGPGSTVEDRTNGIRGRVVEREFDALVRDWFYTVQWSDGLQTREPFLQLREIV